MKYPNAYRGLGKLFVAQILEIVGVIVLIVAAVLILVGISNADMTMAGTAVFLFLAAGIVVIISYIFNLVGFAQAKKDEDPFLIRLIFIIVAIVSAIASTAAQSVNEKLSSWLSFAALIFEIAVIENSSIGIKRLATNIGDQKVAKTAEVLRILMRIVWLIVLVLRLFNNIQPEIGGILYLIAGIVELVASVMYIVLLSKAKKMLAKTE